MINLTAVAIRNQLDLKSKEMRNFVVLAFSSGETFTAQISKEALDRIVELSGFRVPDAPKSLVPVVVAQQAEVRPPEQMVRWRELSDEDLSSPMKKALEFLKIPDEMPISVLKTTLMEIQEKFGPEEWSEVYRNEEGEQEAEKESEQLAQPEIGVTTWGPPPVVNRAPARTVSQDASGNPIVPGMVSGASEEDSFGAQQI